MRSARRMISARHINSAAASTALVVTLLVLNAYPIYQLATTGGPLFFTNGFDEAVYLQYDFSRTVQHLTRPGQYLVTWAHELGISGGWINFVLDLTVPLLFLLLLRAIALRLGFQPRQADLIAIAGTILPTLAGGANPLVSALFRWNLDGPGLAWLTVPEAHFLPLFRSPEPQFSLAVAAIAVVIALALRSYWPAYAAAPFLYNFVAVPYLFVVVSLHLHHIDRVRRLSWPVIAALAFLMVSAALALFLNLLVPDSVRRALVPTRAPLVSFTSVAALLVYVIVRSRLQPHLRLPVLLLALAPLAAANQHVISGWMAQPNNYEQAVGVLVVGLVAAFGFASRPRLLLALIALALVLLLRFTGSSFRDTYSLNAYLHPRSELFLALQSHPDNVVVNHLRIASLAGLIAPRQPVPLLAYENTFGDRAGATLPTYLCVKQLLRLSPAAAAYEETFRTLDAGYRFQNTDFILLHLGRRRPGPPLHDPNAAPASCPALQLDVFVVGPHSAMPVSRLRFPPDSALRAAGSSVR
jgi:hypothetical protein